MCVLTSNQTNKHLTIRAFLFIPPSRMEERIYIGQCSTVTKNKLRWENIWKVYKQSNRNSKSEVISQCESCIMYNLSLMIFALLSFQIAFSHFHGRSFSLNIRFKVTPSGFKLNKYYNYNTTGPQLYSNYCFIALEKKVERVNRLGLVC